MQDNTESHCNLLLLVVLKLCTILIKFYSVYFLQEFVIDDIFEGLYFSKKTKQGSKLPYLY